MKDGLMKFHLTDGGGRDHSSEETNMAEKKPKGWVKEPVRHGLAARGIRTGRSAGIKTGVRSEVHRPEHAVKALQKLGYKYSEPFELPEGVTVPVLADWKEGSFMGGKKWIEVPEIHIKGQVFDKDTRFMWKDPDWPNAAPYGEEAEWLEDYVEGRADEDDERAPQRYFHFRAENYMIHEDGQVDIMPADPSGLGRIGLFSKDYQGKWGFTEDELEW